VPVVRFVQPDGREDAVDVPVGVDLKQAALDALVPGIIGDCGGFATCGTCHGYLDADHADLVPPPSEDEEIMLEGVLGDVVATSRLTCQVVMTEDLAGAVVTLPEVQG